MKCHYLFHMKCQALFVLEIYEISSFICPGSQALFVLEIYEMS